jgi:hypothetical protein
MVKGLQSNICPLPVHHQEVDLIVVVLPGKISSLLRPRQWRQKMLVPKVALDCERASLGHHQIIAMVFMDKCILVF